jgi:hypothetical protein
MASASASPQPPKRPAIAVNPKREKDERHDEIGNELEPGATGREGHKALGERQARKNERELESFGLLDLQRHVKDDGRALILYTLKAQP